MHYHGSRDIVKDRQQRCIILLKQNHAFWCESDGKTELLQLQNGSSFVTIENVFTNAVFALLKCKGWLRTWFFSVVSSVIFVSFVHPDLLANLQTPKQTILELNCFLSTLSVFSSLVCLLFFADSGLYRHCRSRYSFWFNSTNAFENRLSWKRTNALKYWLVLEKDFQYVPWSYICGICMVILVEQALFAMHFKCDDDTFYAPFAQVIHEEWTSVVYLTRMHVYGLRKRVICRRKSGPHKPEWQVVEKPAQRENENRMCQRCCCF